MHEICDENNPLLLFARDSYSTFVSSPVVHDSDDDYLDEKSSASLAPAHPTRKRCQAGLLIMWLDLDLVFKLSRKIMSNGGVCRPRLRGQFVSK